MIGVWQKDIPSKLPGDCCLAESRWLFQAVAPRRVEEESSSLPNFHLPSLVSHSLACNEGLLHHAVS